MKKKEDYLKAIDELLESYDAYYFINKYSDLDKNTHGKQLKILYELFDNDYMCKKALNWIQYAYECYYKQQVEEDEENAFNYLKKAIEKRFGDSNE